MPNMKKLNLFFTALLAAIPFFGYSQQKASLISVDVARQGVEIPEGLWGIFYEEINRAGDGGLFPEMIYNMGFEEKNIPATTTFEDGNIVAPAKPNYGNSQVRNFRFRFNADEPAEGWTLELNGASNAEMKVVTDNPLHKANPHSLEINLANNKGGVSLINKGFEGISLEKGEPYDFFFYLRADKSFKGKVTASLIGAAGNVITTNEFKVSKKGEWIKYSALITAPVTDNQAKLELSFTSAGKVWLDYVSLMPKNTFMNHGLRKDIAQTLASMKPKFIRWPGGCIVEGFTMENRVNWKETIGERISRPGQFDIWGYHNTYNFGYHEFLQYCEDIGAVGMFVCNAGLSCSVRNGDYYEMGEMGTIVQDALDAIEYALGDVSTKWGAERARNGHPKPFPLKYVEIGNENGGPLYGERYNLIYKALDEKYPQITYINTNGLEENLPDYYDADKIEMIDPHYYNNPEFFFSNTTLYDNVARGKWDVYIGEYACNSNVGTGTLYGALSEAAFMTGIERNSDLVKIASYAPLLENVNYRQWPTNLIRFKNDAVFGRSSYYVQKMFSDNRPDVNLATTLDWVAPEEKIAGQVGFDAMAFSPNSQVMFKDFTVSAGTGVLYKSDFPTDTANWTIESGDWQVIDNAYTLKPAEMRPPGQGGGQRRFRWGNPMILEEKQVEDCAVSVSVKRDSVFNGINIRFGVTDENNYYQLSIGGTRGRGGFGGPGGPGDRQNQPTTFTASVVRVSNGGMIRVGNIGQPFEFGLDKWHDVKLTVNGKQIGCSIDGVIIGEIEYKPLQKQYAIAGYDKAAKEVVIKVVNGESTPFATSFNLQNVSNVNPAGKITTLFSASGQDDNSFEEPTKVSPGEADYTGFKPAFDMTFEPYSFTILRIKAE